MSNKAFSILKAVNYTYQQVRCYPRWTYRNPKRVLTPEEFENEEKQREKVSTKKATKPVIDVDDENDIVTPASKGSGPIKWKQPIHGAPTNKDVFSFKIKSSKNLKPLTASKESPKEPVDILETIIDNEGNFIYTKMKNNDSRVGMILTNVKSSKQREKQDFILLEGKRLIVEALLSKCKLEYILFSRMKELEVIKPYLPKIGAKLYKIPYREMQMWSDLTTAPGIMAIFKTPDTTQVAPEVLPITVICDNIREPNNLGAILRTCSGIGCEKVILTKGCVNVWETKVLRSACGAHFKLNIQRKSDWKEIQEGFTDCRLFIADNRTADVTEESPVNIIPYYSVDFKNIVSNQGGEIVIVIGGETEGVSAEAYDFCKEYNGVRLNIPLMNGVESLNSGTALGVIGFEIKRQLSMKNDEQ